MTLEFTHQEIGEEVQARAGSYAITDELRLKYDGREILCIIGYCNIDASCCGNRSFRYAIVPGYIVTWKGKKNKAGRPISEVEPLVEEKVKQHVIATLKDTQIIFRQNIEFWQEGFSNLR